MARRRTHVEVSMFPFLSVLCTVIGVLVLFIVLILSTRVVVEDERYQVTEEHKRKVKPGRENVLDEGIDPEFFTAMEAELAKLDRVLVDRQQQRDRLQQQLSGLENLLEIKKTDLLIPITRAPRPKPLNEPEPVDMVPMEGFQVPKKPIFVEVSSSGYTIHPTKEQFSIIERSNKDGGGLEFDASKELKVFLRGVDGRKKREYLLFLIHPNGFNAFSNMRSYLRQNHDEVSLGWEPFSREWIMVGESGQ